MSIRLLAMPASAPSQSDLEIVANNLRRLMAHYDLRQVATAKRCHVSQRTVSNLLHPEYRNTVTLDSLAGVAQGFGLPTWALLVPGIPDEILLSNSLPNLVETYLSLPGQARENLDRIADNERRYTAVSGKP